MGPAGRPGRVGGNFRGRGYLNLSEFTRAQPRLPLSSLRLLKTRVELPKKDGNSSPWPELAEFNCYACHERNKIGGPEDALNKFFQTLQPEMGDEGRVPPPLDGAGAKLKADYVK